MKRFLKICGVVFVVVFLATFWSVTPAKAEGVSNFGHADFTLPCADELGYLINMFEQQYKLKFQAVEDDFNNYTSGIFSRYTERSIIILREPTKGYIAIIGEVNLVQGTKPVVFYCVFAGFRPLTAADAI